VTATKKEAAFWWRSHFDDNPTYRPANQIKARIEGVERFLALEPRSRVLDLACGSGRQALELARRGHRVLGVDGAEEALSQARTAARGERLNVHFLKMDIRQIPYRAEFDAVVNLFSSFGYFASERDDLKALDAARKALKPGGKLLLDLLNKEWLMRHFEPNFWEQGEDGRGSVVLDQISFNFENGRLDNHRTIVAKDGTRAPSFVSFRVYTLTELKALLAQAGLTYQRCWGSFDGAAYGMDTSRMIVLAEKPPETRRVKHEDDDLPRAIQIKGRRR
jgi:SAM-dependent methyltransferase